MYGLLKVVLCYLFYCILSFCFSSLPWLASALDLFGFTFASLFLSWQLAIILNKSSRRSQRLSVDPENKCVLITGCDTGFGHEIALQLNKTGFTVFAGCLFKDGPDAQSLVTKAANPEKMNILQFNVTKESDARSVYETIEKHTEKTGQVFYSLINNAGISGFAPMEWGSFKEDVQPVLEVNLNSAVKVVRTMIPLLKRNTDSRIIMMTSYATHIAMPFLTSYCVSKCGLKAFSDCLRNDFEHNEVHFNGLRVITIEPTAYKTGIVGYENLKKTLRSSWQRTNKDVQDSYGEEIFDGMVAFVSICQFFRWFDFIALKRDLTEVSRTVNTVLLQPNPDHEIRIITKAIEFFSSLIYNYFPQDLFEAGFSVAAYVGYIFVHEVALIKRILNAIVNVN